MTLFEDPDVLNAFKRVRTCMSQPILNEAKVALLT